MEIYSDGGARGNPGPSACAFVVFDGGKLIEKGSSHLGVGTNNQAEYQGVILALEWAKKDSRFNSKDLNVNFFVDSELIAKQIKGLYKVKDPTLKSLYSRVKDLLAKIPAKFTFQNIPRAKNKMADFLVNETLDKVQ
jgi:ribonuclease HI